MTRRLREFSRNPFELLAAAALLVMVVGLARVAQTPPAPPARPPAGQGAGRGAGAEPDPTLPVPDFTKQPPVLPRTPAEELKRIILQPGYHLELVLSEPQITDPTSIA